MSEPTPHDPESSLERVEAAIRRLDLARPLLWGRSIEEVLEPLGAVLDQWRDPRSRWRRELLHQHPEAAGFSRETVEAGLKLGLKEWSASALRELVERELGPLQGRPATRLVPFARTSVLLAGSIPNPTLLQCLLPLLVRSPTLVRPGSRDPVTARLVAASIAALDPELGRCIEVVDCPSTEAPAMQRFLASDCVVVSGSDETIEEVRRSVRPGQRLVAYGHKLSIAVLGPEATRSDDLGELADALSLDVALWDQLGCLSPVSIFVIDPEPRPAASRVAEALFEALSRREAEMPRGRVDAEVAAAIARGRSEADMRAAGGQPVEVHASMGTRFSVIREAGGQWRESPLHRFVRVHGLPDLLSLSEALLPLGRHLSAVALAGFEESADPDQAAFGSVARLLSELGASRICRPGRMQCPPLGWHHDGRPLLLPIARIADRESG